MSSQFYGQKQIRYNRAPWLLLLGRMVLVFFIHLGSTAYGQSQQCHSVFNTPPSGSQEVVADLPSSGFSAVFRNTQIWLQKSQTWLDQKTEPISLRWGRNYDPGLRLDLWNKEAGHWKKLITNGLLKIYNGPVRLFSPAPLPVYRTDIGKIFEKNWKKNTQELTEDELNLLERYGVKEFALKQKEFLKENPSWRRGRLTADRVKAALAFLALSVAGYQAVDSLENVVTFEQYVRLPDFSGGQPVVHLLTETVPIPHTSLRIGGQVYSYANGDATTKSTFEYFLVNPTTSHKVAERSVRFVELKFSSDEVRNLRQYLENQVGKKYLKKLLVNDGSTMIVRAIEKNTDLNLPAPVDSFPNTLGVYLATIKLAGDRHIGQQGLILHKESSSLAMHLSRNFYIAQMEFRAFSYSSVYTVPRRALFEYKTDDSELEWWDLDALTLNEFIGP